MKALNNQKGAERIYKVFEFTIKNYKHEIYLREIAGMLNTTPVSFSRYFNHHTLRTFSE